MTVSKNQNTETKKELSETELNQASGGIIAVLRKASEMDGSVVPSPMTTEAQRGIIAI